MVALSVPRLGFEPQVCLARPVLLDALACYERGDYTSAGVRLRESVRRFLVAACRWYAVPLLKAATRDRFAGNLTLAKALREAKIMDDFSYDVVKECVQLGNAAAHCRPFCVKSLRGCISMFFALVDSEPYSAMRERDPLPLPAESSQCECEPDDDDDEDGDAWKIGGAV